MNVNTPEWRFIEGWAQDKVRMAHAVIENMTLDDRTTCYHRGRLSALRQLLALGTPTPVSNPDDSPGQGA